MDTKEQALAIHALGANVVAIRAGNKKPAGEWQQWQTEPQMVEDVEGLPWDRADRVGIINGVNGWRSFDVDGHTEDDVAGTIVEVLLGETGLKEYPWVERSQSGTGWHVWFICPEDSEIYNLLDTGGKEPGVFHGTIPTGGKLELRWKSNATIVAGTAAPERFRFGSVPTISPAVVSASGMARAFMSVAIPQKRTKPPKDYIGKSEAGNRPGDDFNVRGQAVVHETLQRHGWRMVEQSDQVEHWQKPHSTSDHAHATLNFYPGLFYCFSTDAPPFEPDTGYTFFALYALLEHGGDWHAAGRAIRAMGYGDGLPFKPSSEQTLYARSARRTDVGNAQVFRELFGDRFRYDTRRKQWLVWSGSHWSEDIRKSAVRSMQDTIRFRLEAALGILDDTSRKEAVTWALASESGKHVEHAINHATAFEDLVSVTTDYDTQPLLLATPTGTLDLSTTPVSFGPPRQEHLISRVTGASFMPEAAAPHWEEFIAQVFPNEDIRSYVQRALGYSITGDTREQAFFICYGSGANGKSTLLNTVRKALGEYGATTSFDTFDADNKNQYGNDIAALRGRRFVPAIESEQSRKLAEARVKLLTGGDAVTCRFLYGEFFEYVPTFKVWLAVNHKPIVRGADHGIWRRIHLIPFNVRFEASMDKTLGHTLEAELPGVLNWLLAGYEMWRKEGLNPPEEVKAATSEYRKENDTTELWLQDMCERDPEATLRAAEGYATYREWMSSHGENWIPSQRQWGLRMTEIGFTRSRRSNGEVYNGLKLKPQTIGKGHG